MNDRRLKAEPSSWPPNHESSATDSTSKHVFLDPTRCAGVRGSLGSARTCSGTDPIVRQQNR